MKIIAFDMDDCLVRRDDIRLAIEHAFLSVLDKRKIAAIKLFSSLDTGWLIEYGGNKRLLFTLLLYKVGLNYHQRLRMIPRCIKIYKKSLEEFADKITVYEDVSALTKIKQPKALFTRTEGMAGLKMVKYSGILHYFDDDLVFLGGDKKEIFGEIVKKFDTSPSDLVVVGDSTKDLCTAKMFGASTIAVDRGFVDLSRLVRIKPNLIVKNLNMIPPWLNSK